MELDKDNLNALGTFLHQGDVLLILGAGLEGLGSIHALPANGADSHLDLSARLLVLHLIVDPSAGGSLKATGLGKHTGELVEVGVAAVHLAGADGGGEEAGDELGDGSGDGEGGGAGLELEVGVHGHGFAGDDGHEGLLERLMLGGALEFLVGLEGFPVWRNES